MKSFDDVLASSVEALGPQVVSQALLEMRRGQAEWITALDIEPIRPALRRGYVFSAPAVKPYEDKLSALQCKFENQ